MILKIKINEPEDGMNWEVLEEEIRYRLADMIAAKVITVTEEGEDK